jgi:hypothetical protein
VRDPHDYDRLLARIQLWLAASALLLGLLVLVVGW